MGIGSLFAGLNKDKKYIAMSSDELMRLGNIVLRDAVSARMMKEAGRREVPQCLELFKGAKRVFYIASLYEAEVSTDGLCRFLVGPCRSAAPYILDALKEIHASRHAELLKKFTSANGIDLNDLCALAIDNSWDYEERKKMYPFDDFLKQFEKLYEKEPLDLRLMQYARNHIQEF